MLDSFRRSREGGAGTRPTYLVLRKPLIHPAARNIGEQSEPHTGNISTSCSLRTKRHLATLTPAHILRPTYQFGANNTRRLNIQEHGVCSKGWFSRSFSLPPSSFISFHDRTPFLDPSRRSDRFRRALPAGLEQARPRRLVGIGALLPSRLKSRYKGLATRTHFYLAF